MLRKIKIYWYIIQFIRKADVQALTLWCNQLRTHDSFRLNKLLLIYLTELIEVRNGKKD